MKMIHRTIPAKVNALIQDPLRGTTAVLLEGKGHDELLPVWIGLSEALAISQVLSGKPIHRPLTHNLLLNSMQSLDASLQHVEVSKIEHDTFFAVLHVRCGKNDVLIDARPSDAIVLALNANVPILVAENVWHAACVSFEKFGLTGYRFKRPLRPTKDLQVRLRKLRKQESRELR